MATSRRGSRKKESTHPFKWLRTFVGPVFILGGWGVISTSFMIGTSFIYFGFLLLYLEVLIEPWVIKNTSLFIHNVLLAVCLFFAGVFTLRVVLVPAPINIESYTSHGEYSDGVLVAGIPWDSHFTDLRVSLTNPIAEDYKDLDLILTPDSWSYKAAILEENTGCLLNPAGGESVLIVPSAKGGATTVTGHRVGDTFEAEDNAGDVFEHFIAKGGYRLRCAKFPSRFGLQVVFAAVSPDARLLGTIEPHNLKPNEWGLGIAELLPVNRFDLLDSRPHPSLVTVHGSYSRGVKRYEIHRDISVAN